MLQDPKNEEDEAGEQQEQEQKTTTTTINELGMGSSVIEEWVDATMKTAISLDPKSYLPELFWSNNTRPDGRIFGQARRTSITTNVLERNAIGSALVKLTSSKETESSTTSTSDASSTQVLAGVTVEIGQPSSTTLSGDIKITCVPSQPTLESWLQRLIIQIIDLEQLGIIPGKSAFGLDVTIAVLNENGNIYDAALLAAIAAIQNTTLPPIVVLQPQHQNQEDGSGRVYTLENDEIRNELPTSWITFPSKQLELSIIPIPLSMGVVKTTTTTTMTTTATNTKEQQWLVDPSKEEAMVCKGGITIVVDGNNLEKILSLEYQGQQQQVSMKQSDLALAIRMAQGRAKELLPLFSGSP